MVAAALVSAVAAAQEGPSDGGQATAAELGQGLYERLCATCHGVDGRGGGEYANLLSVPPPDLTGIAARRDGAFPRDEIVSLIDGRLTPRAHGSAEMPVWGRRLRAGDLEAEGELGGEIYLLVSYLETLQPTTAHPADEDEDPKVAQAGAEPFARNCAACHGVSGAGDGPTAASLATPPPDLRSIARRNDGRFPTLRVARAIDGRDRLGAHGSRDMPIWGRRLRAPGGVARDAVVRGEVMLYVEYLRSIQLP